MTMGDFQYTLRKMWMQDNEHSFDWYLIVCSCWEAANGTVWTKQLPGGRMCMHICGSMASIFLWCSAKPVIQPSLVLACFGSFTPSVWFLTHKTHTELAWGPTAMANQGHSHGWLWKISLVALVRSCFCIVLHVHLSKALFTPVILIMRTSSISPEGFKTDIEHVYNYY